MTTIDLIPNSHGGWDVALIPGVRRADCESLDEARRVAFFLVPRSESCRIAVHDGSGHLHSAEVLGPCRERL
ncbi:MAG: hypothetical protein AB7V58_12925 [Solirubrobacterales bacterium]